MTMRLLRWTVPACALAVSCASSPKPVQKLDDSGLSRLDESQMQPVDDARVELGRAQDALARARANEADAQARLEVAKTERAVADAQMKRALAERDLLKKQYAPQDQLVAADEEVRAAQDRIRAADMKRAYLERMVQVAQADRNAAAAHVDTAAAMVEQAKLRAMKAADVPQAQSANAGAIDSRLAEAQLREAQLRKQAADLRAGAVDAYNRWQQTDTRVRTLARPETNIPVPPPTGPDSTR
jgi:chromosome segregation ATPase